jgi:predicted alpha/beta superfamily hydrolase
MIGTLKQHRDFPSKYVKMRNVHVWLPPGYTHLTQDRYPVLYMHDGQNLFESETSFIGVDWGIDVAMNRLIEENGVPASIVVGIWNTPERVLEYMPEKPFASPAERDVLSRFVAEYGGPPCSDSYLAFIIEELKPFLDRHYRTLPDREYTFIMGSSMGALVSLYALCEYPNVFAGAACLSTHWPVVADIMPDYLKGALPKPGRHRIYFDYGTETLDFPYESHQKSVDVIMRQTGYEAGRNWMTRKFSGAEHSERAWRERVHIPLAFLLAD